MSIEHLQHLLESDCDDEQHLNDFLTSSINSTDDKSSRIKNNTANNICIEQGKKVSDKLSTESLIEKVSIKTPSALIYMDATLHKILNNLRVMSLLKPGQKLDFTKSHINIYEDTYATWVYRKIYGENKAKLCNDLYNMYEEIYQFAQNLKREHDNSKENQRQQIVSEKARDIIHKLYGSLMGIKQLRDTYKQFPQTMAFLMGIEEDYIIKTMGILFTIVNIETLSEEITEKFGLKALP